MFYTLSILSSLKSLSFIQAQVPLLEIILPYVTSAPHIMSDLPLIVSLVSKLSVVVPCFIVIMKFPFPLWMGSHWCSLLHCLPLVPALVFVPSDSLKDLTLIICLHAICSVWLQSFQSRWEMFIFPGWLNIW